MDMTFEDFLRGVLDDRTINKSQEQIAEIGDRLFRPSYGICLGCKGQLSEVSADGTVYYSHTDSDTLQSCTYTDAHGMVPEWAFFPKDLFED